MGSFRWPVCKRRGLYRNQHLQGPSLIIRSSPAVVQREPIGLGRSNGDRSIPQFQRGTRSAYDALRRVSCRHSPWIPTICILRAPTANISVYTGTCLSDNFHLQFSRGRQRARVEQSPLVSSWLSGVYICLTFSATCYLFKPYLKIRPLTFCIPWVLTFIPCRLR